MNGPAVETSISTSTSPEEKRRQLRRRRILENSQSRLNKVKNLQRSPGACEDDSSITAGNKDEVPDPPDEVIFKPDTSVERVAMDPPVQSEPVLSYVIRYFSSGSVWRMRTVLAILCGLLSFVLENIIGIKCSHLVFMTGLYSVWLVYVLLAHHPSKPGTAVNPLGSLSLLKLPLMMVNRLLSEYLEPVCMCLWLVALILRDLLVMLFVNIVSKCIYHYTIRITS